MSQSQETTPDQIFSLSTSTLEELRNTARQKAQKPHKWVQRGPYLVGITDNTEIGLYIGTDKILQGFNEKGEPIIVNI